LFLRDKSSYYFIESNIYFINFFFIFLQAPPPSLGFGQSSDEATPDASPEEQTTPASDSLSDKPVDEEEKENM
jgi:hypothetical protein